MHRDTTPNDRKASPAPVGEAGEELAALGRFSLLYESDDERLCLFEDCEGHLSAVDASRFA